MCQPSHHCAGSFAAVTAGSFAGDPSAAGTPAQTQHIARSASNQCVLLKVAVGEASAALFGVHCFLLLPTRVRHFGRLAVLPKEQARLYASLTLLVARLHSSLTLPGLAGLRLSALEHREAC